MRLEEAWPSAGTCRRSPRSANAQEDPGERDLCRYRRPPTSWRVVLPVLSRACCSFPVACTEPLAARRCWVRPALSEEFAFSSYLRKGLYDLRGASPGWSPRLPALTSAFCAQRLLSRLPRPAPPRSEYEEGSRGTGLCRPAAVRSLWGRLGFWWQVAGKGRAHARVRGTPLTARGRRGTGGFGRAALGSRSHPPPFPPCPPSRVRPSHARPRPGHSRGEVVSRVVRAACSRASAVAASSPPSTAAFPRPVEIAGAVLPPLPPPRGSRGSVNRGVGLALGGGLLIWGNRRSAASGASSDVGTRCHAGVFVGWRRRLPRFALASAGVSSGSRGLSVGFGSARCRGRGGTAPGWVQCDSRRLGSRARSPPERPPGPL